MSYGIIPVFQQLKTESQPDTGHLIQFVDNGLPCGSILHINVENMSHPVSMDTIANIFKKHGSIQKIVTFTKNNVFQVRRAVSQMQISQETRRYTTSLFGMLKENEKRLPYR